MNNKIIVKGMHCESCKMLVKMELEENGFEDKITNIELEDGNIGVVNIKELNDEELQKAKELVNAMGSYKVVEEVK